MMESVLRESLFPLLSGWMDFVDEKPLLLLLLLGVQKEKEKEVK